VGICEARTILLEGGGKLEPKLEDFLKFKEDANSKTIDFKKMILARLEGGIRVRRTGQYVVEDSDR
jgi:hypothetical protein